MLYCWGLRLQSSSTQARLHTAAEQILGESLPAPISLNVSYSPIKNYKYVPESVAFFTTTVLPKLSSLLW